MSHNIFPKTNTCCSSSPQLGQENILTPTPPPPPMKGIRHTSPLPPSSSVLSFRMFQESSSLHTYPPPKLIKKKTVHTPTPEGMCPMLPSPTPLDFLEELQCPNIPPPVVLTVTNNTKAQMLDTLFIV